MAFQATNTSLSSMGLEDKRALIAKEDWSLSEKVTQLVRDFQKKAEH